MDTLLKYEDQLLYSYEPRFRGPPGPTNWTIKCKIEDLDLEKHIHNHIYFTIEFPDNSLFDIVLEDLKLIAETDDIKIAAFKVPERVVMYFGRFAKSNMACDECGRTPNVGRECVEEAVHSATLSRIDIKCYGKWQKYEGTKFYDDLNNNGFLIKYFPQWYKENLCREYY